MKCSDDSVKLLANMICFSKQTSPTKNPTLRRAIIQSDQNNFPKRLLSIESGGSITHFSKIFMKLIERGNYKVIKSLCRNM